MSDPVGAIGTQADLAAYVAMGCRGLSVTTGLLIGDTARVEDIQVIDADWVVDQARALLEDMPVAAFKIGTVGSVENISAIAEIVSDYPDIPLILDPFASALNGVGEENEDILIATRDLLVPQTTLMLASAVELSRLADTWSDNDEEDTLSIDTVRIIESGCSYLLITNTQAEATEVANTLFDESGVLRHDKWQRLPGSYYGAGNTISATIAAMLANGMDLNTAVFEAQEFTIAAIAHAERLGMGRLVIDRYFWARESSNDNDIPSTN